MSRPAAEDRLRRILAVVPWVVAAEGPTLEEVTARFGYRSPHELREDLDLLFVCGVPPYTPDTLVEVDVADGRVWIRYADWFARPLRLTAAEALTLVAASTALLGTPAASGQPPAAEVDTPLARGLAKLAKALGVGEEMVDVALGPAPPTELRLLEEASRSHRQVEIDYYAYGRDEHTTRVIDPHIVYSASGQWYVAAFCHLAGDDRLFRIDRVTRVAVQETGFEPRSSLGVPPLFAPSAGDPLVVLDLPADAAWVATQYPTESVTPLAGGRLRVGLRASGDAWLARLVLRVGPEAHLVVGDASAATAAARRILDRYTEPPARAGTTAPVTVDPETVRAPAPPPPAVPPLAGHPVA